MYQYFSKAKLILFIFLLTLAQKSDVFALKTYPKRTMNAAFTDATMVIDGILDDEAWENAEVYGDFLQSVPYNGEPATEKTEVRVLYNHDALYIGAFLYESSPDSIRMGLGMRDSEDTDIDADLFVVELNPYNDDLLSFDFKVSTSNVQIDEKVNFDTWDKNWNAVWFSKTRVVENGWVVEMKIPYSALRIPNKDIQTWGIQFWRNIRRKSEWDSWSFFNESVHGATQQLGILTGIANIKPPVRLAITPYVSSYYDKVSNLDKGDFYMRGGLDLKYGINKSYTLDMMVIPDFGQTPSDDNVLNLSSVETFYDEKRNFFTEGTELFNRANLFYSRRIGGTPTNRDGAYDATGVDETVLKNPNETQLVNSTKLTGRSANGLAVGAFTATSLSQSATIEDTLTGVTRKFKTQVPTHYGILVLDQALKNNSYISLINTHVSYFDEEYLSANVLGTDMKFATKGGGYTFNAKSAYSHLDKGEKKDGYYYEINGGKTSGQFRYSLWHQIRSDKYDPRDLGYIDENNRINNRLLFAYNYYTPAKFFLSWYNSFQFVNNYHYNPAAFTLFEFHFESGGTLKNNMGTGIFGGSNPIPKYDFNEPRVDGRKYREGASGYLGAWYNTDKNRRVWARLQGWYWMAEDYGRKTWHAEFQPTFKISDRFAISLSEIVENGHNSIGYVKNNDAQDSIFFGRRESLNITSVLEGRYMFSANASLKLRGRYYWSAVDYHQFYLLSNNGRMNPNAPFLEDENVNYSSFNIDLSYNWQFAPGSELSVVWKNAISDSGSDVAPNYSANLKELWDNPQLNSLSLKVLYYLDYNYLKKRNKG